MVIDLLARVPLALAGAVVAAMIASAGDPEEPVASTDSPLPRTALRFDTCTAIALTLLIAVSVFVLRQIRFSEAFGLGGDITPGSSLVIALSTGLAFGLLGSRASTRYAVGSCTDSDVWPTDCR